MGPFNSVSLGGFRFANKVVDQHTKWREIVPMTAKSHTVDTIQFYNQTVVIPSGLRLEQLKADKGVTTQGRTFVSTAVTPESNLSTLPSVPRSR